SSQPGLRQLWCELRVRGTWRRSIMRTSVQVSSAFPVSSVDPFADDFLAEPYPFHEELREAGPVVWLERYGLWACARHAEGHAVLSDWGTFSSAAGGGIDDLRPTK